MNEEDTANDDASIHRLLTLVATTTHPPAATTSTTGGAVTLLCPRTGAIQASGRLHGGEFGGSQQQQWGVQGLSFFPTATNVNQQPRIALAYGVTTTSHKDTTTAVAAAATDDPSFATLVSLAPNAASVQFVWRCRFPASIQTVTTFLDRYLLAGTSDGTLLVWNLWQEGALVCTIPHAHYQAVTTCLVLYSSCAVVPTMLLTGGADGRVLGWNVRDVVVAQETRTTPIQPMRTWTCHQLPVTSLAALSSGRFVSAGEDGQVVVLDVAVERTTLLVVQIGQAVTTLATTPSSTGVVYAGCANGAIQCLDLDQYALERSATRNGAVAVNVQAAQEETQNNSSLLDSVLGTTSPENTKEQQRLSVLHGHDRAVTALAVLDTSGSLASGDAGGTIRLWKQGTCWRVVQPWKTANTSTASVQHPVSSLTVLWKETPSPFGRAAATVSSGGLFDAGSMVVAPPTTSSRHKSNDPFLSLFAPLQTIPTRGGIDDTAVAVPFLRHPPDDDDEEPVLGHYPDLFATAKRHKREATTAEAATG